MIVQGLQQPLARARELTQKGINLYLATLERIENKRLRNIINIAMVIALFDIGVYLFLTQTIGALWASPLVAQFFSFVFATASIFLTRQ